MRRSRRCLALLTALALLAPPIPAFVQTPRAERPAYAVGEKWIRDDGTYELTRIEGDLYRFVAGVGREIHLTRDLTIARTVRDGKIEMEFDPPMRLPWPLEVGKWGIGWGRWRPSGYEAPPLARYLWKVEAYEEVRVPAGTFKAFRVLQTWDAREFLDPVLPGRDAARPFSKRWDLVTWYAPEARQLVRATIPSLASLSFEVLRLESSAKTGTGTQPALEPKAGPLSVVIRYPEDRAQLTEPASVVAAVVSAAGGVAAVRVTLNGVVVHQQTERQPEKSVAVSVPITLREGANAIVVSATGTDGTVQHEVRAVFYERARVATVPGPPPPSTIFGDRWAVVIGVGHYESPDIPRLRYAAGDAELVYQTLVGPAGFKKEHVLLLTDRTERKPTLRNIKWALGTFLARSAKKNDIALIFFAGHGAPEIDPRGIERDGLAKYLVPSDADPEDLYSTALPMDEIQNVFGRIEADRLVALLDTCYSGAAGGRTFATKKTRAGHVDDLFLERLTRSKGRAIITASRANEVSVELAELGHGLFTYYLAQGLNGAADLNRDGIVSLQELYEYLEQEVTRKSRAVGANQHPVMKGELEGVLPLVKLSGR